MLAVLELLTATQGLLSPMQVAAAAAVITALVVLRVPAAAALAGPKGAVPVMGRQTQVAAEEVAVTTQQRLAALAALAS